MNYNQSSNTDFNFIMILFYYDKINRIVTLVDKFQFHYDLILFYFMCCIITKTSKISISLWSYSILEYGELEGTCCLWFQFHYDLILLTKWILCNKNSSKISISLWSYSIRTRKTRKKLTRIISISLWSYSISNEGSGDFSTVWISISLWSYSIWNLWG